MANYNINESVSFMNFSSIDNSAFAALQLLPFNINGSRRICLHDSDASNFHVMLVELAPDRVFPYHCHLDSDELSVLLSGSMDIRVLRDRYVDVFDLISLNACRQVSSYIKRGTFHSNLVGPSGAIYVEAKAGPFDKKSMIFL